MADFISKYSSEDFDNAMDGGYAFSQGQFISQEQLEAFIANGNLVTKAEIESLLVDGNEVEY